MSDRPCQHPMLTGSRWYVARCRPHDVSASGAAVWAWSRDPMPPRRCPCDTADRFVVATDGASRRWLQSADVVLGAARIAVCDPLSSPDLLRELPGCTLVATPVGREGTWFRTRTEQVVTARSEMCGVCLYPWLVTGHRLTELVTAS